MKRTTIVASALTFLVVACGAEAAPPADPSALDAAASELTLPESTTTTTAPSAGDMMDDHDDAMDDHDETMDDHDEMMDDHDEAMDDHDEAMDDHDEAMGEHRVGEFIPEPTGEPTMEMDIVISDFAFDPDLVVLPAGETVRFHITNDGLIQHEFRLSNGHRIDEHIAAGHEDHGEEAGHHEGEEGDIIMLVEPGETRMVDITLPADTGLYTTVACLLPGHYEAGMFSPIEYQ